MISSHTHTPKKGSGLRVHGCGRDEVRGEYKFFGEKSRE